MVPLFVRAEAIAVMMCKHCGLRRLIASKHARASQNCPAGALWQQNWSDPRAKLPRHVLNSGRGRLPPTATISHSCTAWVLDTRVRAVGLVIPHFCLLVPHAAGVDKASGYLLLISPDHVGICSVVRVTVECVCRSLIVEGRRATKSETYKIRGGGLKF